MATLERITYTPSIVIPSKQHVHYHESKRPRLLLLPQLFWKDSTPWREANLWAHERATATAITPRTISANLNSLLNYANFLEEEDLSWFTFPIRKADRCLVRYRKWLIDQRDIKKSMAPSTVTEYMRNVIAFYRWLQVNLLITDSPLWCDKPVYIRSFDTAGFERTFLRVTTDLSIPNRAAPGDRLEDGLFPISNKDRDELLSFARSNSTPELFRMLALGFFTGMRIGTISDLKIQTLKNAIPDPRAPGLFRLSLGPSAEPPVATKFGITGQAWIPENLLLDLLEYSHGIRRSKRQALAAPEDRDLVFLTSHGNAYSRRRNDQSGAINTEMFSLRRAGILAGLTVLKKFKFHQSRCTFATDLTQIAMRAGSGPINAVALVKEALLHKNESTAMKYIKFVEKTPAKIAASDEFMRLFSGFLHEQA